eukprot:scaffold58059_cov66-Phaeocystis_antarctica.AAC.1
MLILCVVLCALGLVTMILAVTSSTVVTFSTEPTASTSQPHSSGSAGRCSAASSSWCRSGAYAGSARCTSSHRRMHPCKTVAPAGKTFGKAGQSARRYPKARPVGLGLLYHDVGFAAAPNKHVEVSGQPGNLCVLTAEQTVERPTACYHAVLTGGMQLDVAHEVQLGLWGQGNVCGAAAGGEEGGFCGLGTCTSLSASRGAGSGASLWRRPSRKRSSRKQSLTDARSSLQEARSGHISRIVR